MMYCSHEHLLNLHQVHRDSKLCTRRIFFEFRPIKCTEILRNKVQPMGAHVPKCRCSLFFCFFVYFKLSSELPLFFLIKYKDYNKVLENYCCSVHP